ncbi:hypothetical protein Hdeb2414_s0008g00291731 [Helianthus debilis subsp. tardiflorus]
MGCNRTTKDEERVIMGCLLKPDRVRMGCVLTLSGHYLLMFILKTTTLPAATPASDGHQDRFRRPPPSLTTAAPSLSSAPVVERRLAGEESCLRLTRPETHSDLDPFRPEPVSTRTKTTPFWIDPF